MSETTVPAAPPATSVIVRNHNSRFVLERAIASVFRQTMADWELIVVDDASSDGTVDWIRASFGGERRMRLIAGGHRQGAAAAANAGIARARGAHIALLDSDDEWEPGFLGASVAALAAAPEAIATYTDHIQVWDQGGLERVVRAPDPTDQRRDMLVAPFIPCLSQMLFRHDGLVALGELDQRLRVVSDRDLLMRAALQHAKPFVHVAGALVRRHFHAGNLMNNTGRSIAEGRTVAHRGFVNTAAAPYEALRERAFAGLVARAEAYGRQRAALAQPSDLAISVVVLARGDGDELERAIATIDAQTHDNRQILVVDAGAAPGATAALAAAGRTDLQVIEAAERGIGAAFNRALAIARGDVVAAFDSRDAWSPDYLASVATAFALAPPPVFSHADLRGGHDGATMPSASQFAARRDMLDAVGGCDPAAGEATLANLCQRLLAHQFRPGVPAQESNAPVRIARPLVGLAGDLA